MWYLAVGGLAGLLAGFLGVGGGVIVVPALAGLFAAQGVSPDYTMPLALGTSLAAIVFTSLASMRAHRAQRAVDWRVVQRLTPGLVFGAFAGASMASRVPSAILAVAFGLFLWCVATYLIVDATPPSSGALPGWVGLSAAGGTIGLVSGVMGIGGGSLTVPFLTWRRVPLHQAIGTAAAAGFPIAVAGAAGYLLGGVAMGASAPGSVGFVHVSALVGVAVAGVMAAPIGARLTHRLPTGPLKNLFALFLYLVGGAVALSGWLA